MPSIRVNGISFDLDLPYAEGHSCTLGEANELNRLRVQRVSSLIRRKMAKATRTLTSADLAVLGAGFTFDSSYAPPKDPQALEAEKIAKGLLREVLNRRGESIAGLGEERYANALREMIASDNVQAEASRRVAATQEIARKALLTPPIDIEGL